LTTVASDVSIATGGSITHLIADMSGINAYTLFQGKENATRYISSVYPNYVYLSDVKRKPPPQATRIRIDLVTRAAPDDYTIN